ncbi:SAP domain-containing protein [Sporobolomyces salmoneus]|uniref:SAP domain-containing protein n=1 Tax=Sporobolomyces salmoneus TaxID=183962 RepID=UPI0031734973
MSYTESSLKALTVVKLKEILSTHSLPVTGKKDDLISRILSSDLSSSDPDTADPTSNATDEPDGSGVGSAQEVGPAATSTTEEGVENGVNEQIQSEGQEIATATEEETETKETVEGPSEEELKKEREERARLEEEKRKARLARFGGNGSASTNGEKDEVEEAKKKRAERFGIPAGEEENDQKKLNKSLDLLDKPLGSNRREKKPKVAATSKSNPTNERTVASKLNNPQAAAEPAAAMAAADPELQKKLAEEEEKKKKRAARFGGGASEPQEKKTKTD